MRFRRAHGFTFVEIMLATGVSALVVGTLIYAQVNLLRSWEYGVQREQVERETQRAFRRLRQLFSEAAVVSVNGDGTVARVRLPQKDGTGNYRVPIEPENIEHVVTVAWSTRQLVLDGQTLLRGVADRRNDGSPYRPFTLIQLGRGRAALHLRLNVSRRMRLPYERYAQTWVEETVFLHNLQ